MLSLKDQHGGINVSGKNGENIHDRDLTSVY